MNHRPSKQILLIYHCQLFSAFICKYCKFCCKSIQTFMQKIYLIQSLHIFDKFINCKFWEVSSTFIHCLKMLDEVDITKEFNMFLYIIKNTFHCPFLCTHKVNGFNKLWNHPSIVLSFLDLRLFRPSSNFCFYIAFSNHGMKGMFSINSFLVLFTMKIYQGGHHKHMFDFCKIHCWFLNTQCIFYIANHSY